MNIVNIPSLRLSWAAVGYHISHWIFSIAGFPVSNAAAEITSRTTQTFQQTDYLPWYLPVSDLRSHTASGNFWSRHKNLKHQVPSTAITIMKEFSNTWTHVDNKSKVYLLIYTKLRTNFPSNAKQINSVWQYFAQGVTAHKWVSA